MLGVMHAVIRTATRFSDGKETQYEREQRIRQKERRLRDAARAELDRQLRRRPSL
ncbi:hypothetical protein STA1M1_03600 [Sinisalibacter aestuarii]|uniref:Transposase n=1 Tax=Sinisalibacter aestuarii TaxID=2949426 RepID=A0ABQ5LNG2_9RHOB|nr:hypothetical protein STA1M1_03600 [Sinisalibacter aestuarii]